MLSIVGDHSSTDDDSDDDDDDDDILRHTSNLLATSVTKLPGGILNIKKMSDANISRRAQVITHYNKSSYLWH